MALTLAETWALTQDQTFLARIRAAAAIQAYIVCQEPVATPYHELRERLADSEIHAASEAPFMDWLLTYPSVQAAGAAITDADLQAAIAALWNCASGATMSY
jgi:uncharacterized membrane protein YidH (DUF202 family)